MIAIDANGSRGSQLFVNQVSHEAIPQTWRKIDVSSARPISPPRHSHPAYGIAQT